jgi:uncharacterized repeat protein (TIGR03803 family)
MRHPHTFSTPAALMIVTILLAATALGQTVTTIYNFSGSDGEFPQPQPLTQGRDGLLYGTTYKGGTNNDGTIFSLNPRTGELTSLYSLGSDGAWPGGGLTLATDGNFYGAASIGGTYNKGVLFRFSPAGVYTVVHEFAGGTDGDYPYEPPIQTENGILYGTSGGIAGTEPYVSALYKFVISSGAFDTVYTFPSTSGQVYGPPVQISNGDFYVSTTFISPTGCGSIVRVTTTGVLKSTYTFPSCAAKQGASAGGMVAAADGNVYGTTSEGGIQWVGGGTIFKDNPKTGIFSVVHDFGSIPNDGITGAGLMQASDGNFYGVTEGGGTQGDNGTLFEMAPGSTYNVLYSFQPTLEGGPYPGVPGQSTTGMFYGTTSYGGPSIKGSIYSLDMGLGPFVTLVCSKGKAGQTIQILGQGLTGATNVIINGMAATSFKVASDTFMTAVVPANSLSGPVVVTTPTGILTSNRVLQIVQ